MHILFSFQLGHETYRVGGPAYDQIISEFGEGVRGEGGDIDRKKLGAIVFSDKVRRTSCTLPWDHFHLCPPLPPPLRPN